MTCTNEKKLAYRIGKLFETRDPFAVCREMGIKVIYSPLVDLLGYYQQVDGIDVICINEGINLYQSYFVCAHELYHALAHEGENRMYMDRHTYQVPGKRELAANRFAALFLFPDDDELIEYSEYSLEQLSAVMGLPAELVNWRYEQIVQLPEGSW